MYLSSNYDKIAQPVTAVHEMSESRYIFSGIQLEKIGKNDATAHAFDAPPIRPRHFVSTNKAVPPIARTQGDLCGNVRRKIY